MGLWIFYVITLPRITDIPALIGYMIWKKVSYPSLFLKLIESLIWTIYFFSPVTYIAWSISKFYRVKKQIKRQHT
jgi:hypothetical protein